MEAIRAAKIALEMSAQTTPHILIRAPMSTKPSHGSMVFVARLRHDPAAGPPRGEDGGSAKLGTKVNTGSIFSSGSPVPDRHGATPIGRYDLGSDGRGHTTELMFRIPIRREDARDLTRQLGVMVRASFQS
jgi:hypothetical protein